MSNCDPSTDLGTHDVHNQPAERGDCDLWESDPALREAASVAGAQSEVLAGYAKTFGQANL